MNKVFVAVLLGSSLIGKALAGPSTAPPASTGAKKEGAANGHAVIGRSAVGGGVVGRGASTPLTPATVTGKRSISPSGTSGAPPKEAPVGTTSPEEATQEEAFFAAIVNHCRLSLGPYVFAHDTKCQQELESFQEWLLGKQCELRPRYTFAGSVLTLQCKKRILGSERDEWYTRWQKAETALRKPRVSRETEEQRRREIQQACVFTDFGNNELRFEERDSLAACATAVERAFADNVPPFSLCRDDFSYDAEKRFSILCKEASKNASKREMPKFDWWKDIDSGPEQPSTAERAFWKVCQPHLSKKAEKKGFVGLLANPAPACVEQMANWYRSRHTKDFGWLKKHACDVWSRDTEELESPRWDADTYQTIILCERDPSSGFAKD